MAEQTGDTSGSMTQPEMTTTPPPRSVMTELPSRWPKAIGIINIIFGCLGFLVGMVGVAYLLFMPQFMQMAAQGDAGIAAQMEELDWSIIMGPQAVAVGAAGLVWSIVLFSAGVMLVRRSRNARFTNMLWALVRMFLTAVGIYLAIVNTPRWVEHLETLAAQGNEMAQNMAAQAEAGMGINVIIGVVLGVPYPLFLLIWFLRPKIKAECAEW